MIKTIKNNWFQHEIKTVYGTTAHIISCYIIMNIIRPFEKQIIRMLTKEALSSSLVEKLLISEISNYRVTGVGYFFEIPNEDLPKGRIVCNSPTLILDLKGWSAGFVLFIQDKELTFECHGWGGELPNEFRDIVPIKYNLKISST